jgi:hypothetical protein
MKLLSVIFFIINMLLFCITAHAAPKNIDPGIYEDWGRRINKLEIIKSFKIADYVQLLIPDIDTSNTQFQLMENLLKEESQKALLNQGQRIVINRIKDNPKNIKVIETNNDDSNNSLIIKISIIQIGVQKKTVWWYPLSWVEIRGEIIDSKNNDVFLKFETRRTSSVKELETETVIKSIKNNFHELGGDLNELILSFN